MLPRLAALAGLLCLAACTAPPHAPAPPAVSTPPFAVAQAQVYRCGAARITVALDAEARRAWVALPDTAVVLPAVVSASGARYGDGAYTYWVKGTEARIETPTATYPACPVLPYESVWEGARLRGVDFRATGNEPGWLLEIHDGDSLVFAMDYGARRIATPAPPPEQPRPGTQVYRITTEAHTATVTLEDRACADTMADETFPATVTLVLDGATYHGCGRALR